MKRFQNPFKKLSRSLTLLAFLSTPFLATTAHGVIIDSSATGLIAPTNTIDFSEIALANGTSVTNQFAGLGVSFTPQMTYQSSVSPRPNFSGPALVNFDSSFTAFDPFSLLFTNNVTEATFAFTKNSGSTKFESLLNGVVQESFTSITSPATPGPVTNFYGFENSLFDEIRVTQIGTRFGALDTLSFTSAPVSDSGSSMVLIALGLAVCGGFKRYMRK